MKEAFEKIIERLEERRKLHADLSQSDSITEEEQIIQSRFCGCFCRAKEIVNQVAEEVLEKEFSEWCHDCKEYDKEKHHCPRWCKVIRTTVEEIKGNLDVPEINVGKNGGWIPCSEKLPDSGRKVLLQTEGNQMTVAFLDKKLKWYADSGDHFCTDLCAKPIAWQPLPEPYGGE